jgi:hypothetical protein
MLAPAQLLQEAQVPLHGDGVVGHRDILAAIQTLV